MTTNNSKSPSEKDEVTLQAGRMLLKIGGTQYSLPNVALLFMLIAVLMPSVIYSTSLRTLTPSELLATVCIALFSSVLFLWIMDATSVLRFRSEWISKSVYGAAIASILGTSVAVYKDVLAERKYPYEGRWEFSISSKEPEASAIKHSAIIIFSESAETYWGYSDYMPRNEKANVKATWTNIEEFDPKNGRIRFEIINDDNSIKTYDLKLKQGLHDKQFKTEDQDKIIFSMYRTK